MAASPTHKPTPARGEELVLRTIAAHAPSLLGTARRYSLCADDAQDAYQRALEIFLRRAEAVDPDHAVGWLRTVVKHEALAVRAGRLRFVGAVEVDLDREEASHLAGAEERAAEREHAERAAEALQRLKPQETRALLLKARGYSYREICEITGWTYTKVNRCLTEGRRAFLERFDQIASGRECARWATVLSALADGEATADDAAAVRPHLRTCSGCRALLREFRAAPGAVAALAPAALATPGHPAPGALARAWEALTSGLHERTAGAAQALHDRAAVGSAKLQAGVETASSAKLAAVAASATALAGGGVAAIERSHRVPAQLAKHRVVKARAAHDVRTPAAAHAGQRAPAPAAAPSPGQHARRSPASTGSRAPRPAAPPGNEFGPAGDEVGAAGADPGVPPGAEVATAAEAPQPSGTSDPSQPAPQAEFSP